MSENIEKSARLKALLKALGLNQTEFSAKVKIPKSNVSEMLSGKRPVSSAVILKIKEQYPSVNIQYLTSGDGEMFESAAGQVIEGRHYTEKQIREMEEKVRRLEAENQALKARLYDEMMKGK